MNQAQQAFELFAQKGGCTYPGPQRTAWRMYDYFVPSLTSTERRKLSTAVSHVLLGEGRAEFDSVCREIQNRLWPNG